MRTGISIGFMPHYRGFGPFMPVEFKLMYGRTHNLELGIGITILPDNILNPTYNPSIDRNDSYFYPVYRFGYRLSYNKLLIRIAPLLHKIRYTKPTHSYFGGISLGLSF